MFPIYCHDLGGRGVVDLLVVVFLVFVDPFNLSLDAVVVAGDVFSSLCTL